jgi:peptidoglycan hydrolase-like protein with peptidoglycan-binding domain
MRARREKRVMVWRYLEYYRLRCPVCNERLPPPAVKAHLHQEQIRIVQQQLKGAGIDPGPINGIVSPQTQEALRQYQKAQGLPQTGQLDEVTKEHLRNRTT